MGDQHHSGLPILSSCAIVFLLTCLLTVATHGSPLATNNATTIEISHSPDERSNAFNNNNNNNNFILLTTGELIKLFPISLNGRNEINSLNEQDALLLKPIDFNASDPTTLDRLGRNSPFTKWIQHKHSTNIDRQLSAKNNSNNLPLANIRQSILPKSRKGLGPHEIDDHDDEHLYEKLDGMDFKWSKPLFAKVDYFFNHDYCQQTGPRPLGECLVVVWLDKANRFLRFGSTLLRDIHTSRSFNRSTSSSSQRNGSNSVLWLHEFPPIDLCKELGPLNKSHLECNVWDFIVESQEDKILIMMSLTNSIDHGIKINTNRLLILALTPSEHHGNQLKYKYISPFNEDCSKAQLTDVSDVANLNFISSNWIFYLERKFGSKLMALDLSSSSSLDDDPQWRGNHSYSPIKQMQVFDVRSNLPIRMANITTATSGKNLWPPALSMALDQVNSRLYFLFADNRLYSSDLIGEDAQLVGQLSPKPAIRSPNAMYVSDGFLYISDVVKKSLIAYKIPSQSDEQPVMTATNSLRPTHQVLIVELPTILDFRIIDRSRSRDQFKLSCDNQAKSAYSELEDDEKLSTCFRLETLESHLDQISDQDNQTHCMEVVFVDRSDGVVGLNQPKHGTTSCYTAELAFFLLVLIIAWLVSGLLVNIIMHLLYYATSVVKRMRSGPMNDGMTTILTSTTGQMKPEKCPK